MNAPHFTLRVEGVSARYRHRQVLEGVRLEPITAGLLPAAGSVRLDGRSCSATPSSATPPTSP